MARSDDRSVSDLQAEAELNRVEFAETVDQLRSKVSDTVTDFRERLSPDAIKAEVGDYFRTRADSLIEKARKNPLQAAAIGVGVGYPLLGIVRSIPAPVLMVGAGLFLLGSTSGQNASRKLGAVADDLSDQIGNGADAVRKNIREVQAMTSDGAVSARAALSSGLESLKQQTSGAGTVLSPRPARRCRKERINCGTARPALRVPHQTVWTISSRKRLALSESPPTLCAEASRRRLR